MRFYSAKLKYIAYDAQSFTLEAIKTSIHIHFYNARVDIPEQPSTMKFLLSWADEIIIINTNTEFHSILEDFFCREEMMVFIPWLVAPPDASFIPARDNVVTEPKTWEAFSHSVNQILQRGQRNSDDVTIPYRYNGWDNEPSICNSIPPVIYISSDEDGPSEAFHSEDIQDEQNGRAEPGVNNAKYFVNQAREKL